MLVKMFGDPGNNFGKNFHFVNRGYNLCKNLGFPKSGTQSC